MLMVIFGAGASFDSVPERDWTEEQKRSEHRPPLAASLFEPRAAFQEPLEKFWECAPLVGRLRNAVARKEAIEEFLEREVVRSEGDVAVLSQMLALRYYIDRVISDCSSFWLKQSRGVTNYAVLLDTIDRWRRDRGDERVVLVTFNYDLLLEDAYLKALRRPLEAVDDYVSGSPYLILKAHGSVSWLRRVRFERDDARPHELIRYPQLMRWTDDYATGAEIRTPQTKSAFECPPEHVTAFRRTVGQIDRVLVVGWRGQEMHFLDTCVGLAEGSRGLMVAEDHAHASETALHLTDSLKAEFEAGTFNGFTGLATQESELMAWLGG